MVKHLSIRERNKIIDLREMKGSRYKTIAREIGCDSKTVGNTLKRWYNHGQMESLAGRGRKSIIDISNKQNNPISNLIKKYRRYSSKWLKLRLYLDYNINVSETTVYKAKNPFDIVK